MAADLMKNPVRFKAAMVEALTRWPRSCEMNLSAEPVNKIAWLGHAGCCVATQSPEDCTRLAWHTLNKAEQDEANRVAAEALELWTKLHDADGFFDLFAYSGSKSAQC